MDFTEVATSVKELYPAAHILAYIILIILSGICVAIVSGVTGMSDFVKEFRKKS